MRGITSVAKTRAERGPFTRRSLTKERPTTSCRRVRPHVTDLLHVGGAIPGIFGDTLPADEDEHDGDGLKKGGEEGAINASIRPTADKVTQAEVGTLSEDEGECGGSKEGCWGKSVSE